MNVIGRTLTARASFLQLLGVAVALGLGVNLLSTWVSGHIGEVGALIVGSALILAVLIVVILMALRNLGEVVSVEAALLVHDQKMVAIPNYAFSEDITRALRGVMSENEALSRQWYSSSSADSKESAPRSGFEPGGAAAKLIHEAADFVVLAALSSHLSEHFQHNGHGKHVQTKTREDLLPLIAGNRVLDQISRPLEDRIALLRAQEGKMGHFVTVHRVDPTSPNELGEVYMATDGTHEYRRLELELPRGTRVSRLRDGAVRLESRLIKNTVRVKFDGYGFNFDPEFFIHYVKVPWDDFRGRGQKDGRALQVMVFVESQLRLRSLLSARGWRLHRWSESFVQKVISDCSVESFLEEIRWDAVRTMIVCMEARPSSSPGNEGPGTSGEEA